MEKALSEMTLEELWALFPIVLSEHKNAWKDWYTDEAKRISTLLPMEDFRINHIGSTAINRIQAKPIIDILVEIPKNASMEVIKEVLTANGYLCMSECENRKAFNKGYTRKGFAEKVFHLHLRYMGDNDELYFRDYMNSHLEAAQKYEQLKVSLSKRYEHNRDAYTNAKGSFVTQYTQQAKKEYKNRYAGACYHD